MINKSTLLSIAIMASFCAGYSTTAQSTSLPAFVRDVIQSSPEVNEQIHVFRQAYQDKEIALGAWLPSLDMSYKRSDIRERKPDSDRYSSKTDKLSLTQNIFSGFDTVNHVKQTDARIASSAYRLYDISDNVGLEAVTAYLNVLSAHKLLKLSEKNVAAHQQTLKQLTERNKAGLGLLSDLEQTRGRLANAKASLISQQNRLQDALTTAHKLLGRYITPDELTAPPFPPQHQNIDSLIDHALLTHPALKSAQYNVKATQFSYKRAKSAYLPTIDIGYEIDDSEDLTSGDEGRSKDKSAFINLSYNLFEGGASLAQRRKSASKINELEAFRKRVHRQVIDKLRLSWIADKSLSEQLPLLALYISKAEKSLKLYREEFRLNKRNLINVLDSMNELNNAEKRHAETFYQALTARFRVYEGIGNLFEPLGLHVSASETDFKIAGIQARGASEANINPNLDNDNVDNETDHCDNSRSNENTNRFGCRNLEGLNTSGDIPPPLAAPQYNQQAPLPTTTQPYNAFPDSATAVLPPSPVAAPDPGLVPGMASQKSQPETVTTRQAPGGAAKKVATVYFGYKQSGLTSKSQSRFNQLIPQLIRSKSIEIRAHTDNVGSQEYNLSLSQRRAELIREMLVHRGVDGRKIKAVGLGEIEPIADNNTEVGRAKNRRVEIIFTTDKL